MKHPCLRTLCLALTLAMLLSFFPLRPEAARAEAGEAARPETDAGAESLRISELMHKNKASLLDEDGDFSDWIELENASAAPLELEGWRLSDRGSKKGWALPARTLAPGELLLIFTDGKDRSEGELHADFSLSEGETL